MEALDKVLKILDTDLGVFITRVSLLTGIGWGFSSLINASKILPTIVSQFSNFTKLIIGATIEIPKAAAAAGGLTAAMATFQSVALPVIGILTALGVGIYAIVKASQEKKQAVDELTKSIKAYDEAVENSNKTLKDTTTETQKTVAIAERYVDRLEALQQKTELTNEEQSEYHAILSNLTTLIPQLSSVIDLQTNSIQGGTQAIRDQIGAWKDLAIQQAYQQKMADVYSAIAEISIEKQQRQSELAALEAERGSLVSRQIVLQQQYQTGKGNLQYAGSPGFAQNMHETEVALIEGQTRLAEIDRDLPSYTEALDKLNSKLSDAEREAALMQDAVTELMAEMSSPVVGEGSSGGEVEPWRGPSWEKLKEYYVTNFPQQIITNLKKLNEEVESTSSASGKTIEEIQEEAEKLKFSIQEYVSESESYIDLLESEYNLMNLQGKSEDELISKAKQLQEEYHKEADNLREILENSEALELSTEEVHNIETNINQLSINWWNWQNKINTLLEKAKESTEGIKEDVEDIYDKYMKMVEAQRKEEKERQANEYKDWETYKYWLKQISDIITYVQQLKASNEELKKQLELQEKLDKLARAKESRVLVYKDGNYEYIQDIDQVSKAAKDLSNYQEEEALEKKINDLLELASAYQTLADEIESGKLGHDFTSVELTKAIEKLGGWREVFGAYPDDTPKTVEEIEINTREIANNLALIGKKIKVFPYAGGTTGASGGLSLVGEKGAELRVLNRGDGVLPANLTSNLMRWGQFSPNEFRANSISGFGSNMSVTIQALNLPNVSNGADFVEYVRTHMFGQVLNLVH